VRNVPARFSTEKLLEVWSPDGTYNFLFVPCRFRRAYRLGMAIINMVSHEAATEFTARWHGNKLVASSGAKRLDIVAAEIQGLMETLQHLKESGFPLKAKHMPLLFKGRCKLDSKALFAHMDLGAIAEDQLEAFVIRQPPEF